MLRARDLATMIGLTIIATTTDEGQFRAAGGLVVLRRGEVMVVATDGHRISVANHAASGDVVGSAIIPISAMAMIRRMAGDDDASITMRSGHVVVASGRRTLIARQMDDTYPDHERFFVADAPISIRVDRDALLRAVRRVILVASDSAVMMDLQPGRIVMTSSSAGAGSARDVVSVPHDAAARVALNGMYLIDILAAVAEDHVTIDLRDASHQVVIRAPGVRYAMMPLRV